jgi:hypothetical protein
LPETFAFLLSEAFTGGVPALGEART